MIFSIRVFARVIAGVVLIGSLMLTSACVSLLTPKVESQFAKLKPGNYQLDPTHTTLLFKVKHLGLSTYVGRFNTVDASLEFDPNDLSATKLSALVDMDSLDINNRSLADDLQGATWLNSKRYPQAQFTSLSVTPLSESRFSFTGQLDWRGIKNPITLEVQFHGGANNILTGKYTLGFSAKGSFLRSDFGMDAFIPLVGDEIALEAYAEFQKN